MYWTIAGTTEEMHPLHFYMMCLHYLIIYDAWVWLAGPSWANVCLLIPLQAAALPRGISSGTSIEKDSGGPCTALHAVISRHRITYATSGCTSRCVPFVSGKCSTMQGREQEELTPRTNACKGFLSYHVYAVGTAGPSVLEKNKR